MGERDSAHAVLALIERPRNHPAYHIAVTYAALNEDAKALDWLERAYDERSDWIANTTGERAWDHLRSNPRFIAVMRKLKLSPER